MWAVVVRAATWILLATTVGCTGLTRELRAVDRDGDYMLVITSPQATWGAGDAIELEATLNYSGGQPEVTLTGSGSGVLFFSVDELDGDRSMDAAWHDDCKPYTFGPGDPISSPYRKSGGFTDEDPNAAFYRAYFRDPVFRLPPGAWKVTAIARFGIGAECGGGRQVMLQAPLTIDVQ
jgi:hypothetical protein